MPPVRSLLLLFAAVALAVAPACGLQPATAGTLPITVVAAFAVCAAVLPNSTMRAAATDHIAGAAATDHIAGLGVPTPLSGIKGGFADVVSPQRAVPPQGRAPVTPRQRQIKSLRRNSDRRFALSIPRYWLTLLRPDGALLAAGRGWRASILAILCSATPLEPFSGASGVEILTWHARRCSKALAWRPCCRSSACGRSLGAAVFPHASHYPCRPSTYPAYHFESTLRQTAGIAA